jgi:hypothetical protein
VTELRLFLIQQLLKLVISLWPRGHAGLRDGMLAAQRVALATVADLDEKTVAAARARLRSLW